MTYYTKIHKQTELFYLTGNFEGYLTKFQEF